MMIHLTVLQASPGGLYRLPLFDYISPLISSGWCNIIIGDLLPGCACFMGKIDGKE